MQLPSVERTANRLPTAAGTQSGVGAAAPKAESALIQEATVKVEAASKPEPSTKVDISTTQKEIAELEAAARLRASASPTAETKADTADRIKSVANVSGTAVSAAVTLAPVASTTDSKKTDNQSQNTAPEDAAKTAKLLAAGKEPGPNQPTATENEPSKDWTTTPQATEKKVENPPPEPMSKKLLDFLQALWRAGGNAVDVNTQAANQVVNTEKQSEGPLTYSDPTVVKKTGSSSSV
jgi:hypothetical protein